MAVANADRERVRERLREDTPYWAEHFAKIIGKDGRKQPLIANPGQVALDAKIEEQRAAGKPVRGVILKARQWGGSTWVQAKIIQRVTQRANHSAVVVAHDTETGGKLYKMGERMYSNLPPDPELGLKPAVASHRRTRFLHFADGAKEAWMSGEVWPDSTYLVDTANEFEAGRGGTYHDIHGSEVAMWADIKTKLNALRNAVPRLPDTMVILESTAKGQNAFKDEWDRAVEGRSDYFAFFWPWWKEPTYSEDFANEAERQAFHIGDAPYGDTEAMLFNPGPLDFDTGKHVPLTKEQLFWRRQTIENECGGDLRLFQQEYPATPDEAFIATGRKVFDPFLVAGILVTCELTDPRTPTPENPGPLLGSFEPTTFRTRVGRTGEIQVPQDPIWKPRREITGPARWKLWLPRDEEGFPVVGAEDSFKIGVDVSDAGEEDTDEPSYSAIEVVNHATKEQVAEWRGHLDADLLAVEALMAALFFHEAEVAVEITGSHGLPVVRKMWHDFHYPRLYRPSRKDRPTDKTQDRLGWDTNRQTRPVLIAGLNELIREGVHGIRSVALAREVQTFVRDNKGRPGPEPGKFSDLLFAYMIAQQIAAERPIRTPERPKRRPPRRPRDPVTGY